MAGYVRYDYDADWPNEHAQLWHSMVKNKSAAAADIHGTSMRCS